MAERAEQKLAEGKATPVDAIYFHLFVRNMDTRRTVITTMLGATLTFGGFVLQRDARNGELVRCPSFPACLHDPVPRNYLIGFAVVWIIYGLLLWRLNRNIRSLLNKLTVRGSYGHFDVAYVRSKLMAGAGFIPFLVCTATYAGLFFLSPSAPQFDALSPCGLRQWLPAPLRCGAPPI